MSRPCAKAVTDRATSARIANATAERIQIVFFFIYRAVLVNVPVSVRITVKDVINLFIAESSDILRIGAGIFLVMPSLVIVVFVIHLQKR